jgi:hypothetical protein
MTTISRTGFGLLAGLALLPLGCGGGTGTVTGKVLFNDQPLPSGTVVFTNADGKGSQTAEIQPDGTYKIEKMPTGPAKVAVMTAPSATAEGRVPGPQPKMPTPPPDKVPEGADPGKVYGNKPQAKKYVKIPEKYADAEKSGLTVTVGSGSQEWNIPLK